MCLNMGKPGEQTITDYQIDLPNESDLPVPTSLLSLLVWTPSLTTCLSLANKVSTNRTEIGV